MQSDSEKEAKFQKKELQMCADRQKQEGLFGEIVYCNQRGK